MFADYMAKQCVAGAEVFFVLARNPFKDDLKTEKIIKNIIIVNAIITNRFIVRASANGFSYIITNRGDEVEFKQGGGSLLYSSIVLKKDITFYAKYYKIIVLVYFTLIIGMIIFLIISQLIKAHLITKGKLE